MNDGIDAMPNIQRHFYPRANAIPEAINCPAVIVKLLTATIFPLNSVGVTSDIYTGTIIEATPTPSPTMTLPIISTAMVGANA
jgi:hypothetical protein